MLDVFLDLLFETLDLINLTGLASQQAQASACLYLPGAGIKGRNHLTIHIGAGYQNSGSQA